MTDHYCRAGGGGTTSDSRALGARCLSITLLALLLAPIALRSQRSGLVAAGRSLPGGQ